MSTLLQLIGFGGAQNQTPTAELPDIFPFPCEQTAFIEIDLVTIYARILTDVLERTQGIPEVKQPLLWDNCVASESRDGLVTLLAKSMYEKSELCLVYDKATDVIRKANSSESSQIKEDYKTSGKSSAGFFITFTNFRRTDMLKIYSALEYYNIAGFYKSSNVSKAVQIKINEMRSSVANADSTIAIKQAVAISAALKGGKDVLLDAKDIIETAKPDVEAAKAATELINQKRSFYLGLPASWITGLAPKGLGDSGEGDAKAVERGLKGYFFSIIKPVMDTIFGVKTTFKSEDFYGLTTALEALKTFELTDETLMSLENKREIINKLFGLPADSRGDTDKKTEPVEPAVTPPAKTPPVK